MVVLLSISHQSLSLTLTLILTSPLTFRLSLTLTLSRTCLCLWAFCVISSSCELSARHRWGSARHRWGSVPLGVSRKCRTEIWGERRWLSYFLYLTNLCPSLSHTQSNLTLTFRLSLTLTLTRTCLCLWDFCVIASSCELSARHRWGSARHRWGSVALCVSQTYREVKWGEAGWLSQFVCLA